MEVMLLHNSLKTHTDLTIPFSNGVTLHLPDGFGGLCQSVSVGE